MKTPLHSFFGKITAVRLNAELQRIFASGLRTQINAALPDWIQLAPYGEWPTRERNDDGTPEAVQIFTQADGEALVKRFNAWHRRVARLARLNSCKVYVGHPDFAPDIWPQRIELGDVVEVSADAHGLNGRIRWNDDAGEQLKKHGFPSVAWDTDEQEPGKERPVMLWSVGMTSRPNIKGVKSAINASPETEPETPPANTMNLLEQIKALLIKSGLLKDTDTDEAVLSGISSMISSVAWQRTQEKENTELADAIKTALNSAEGRPLRDGLTALINAHADLQTAAADRDTRINAATAEASALNERINVLTAERDAARATRINAELCRLVETGRLTKAQADDEGADGVRARLNTDPDKVLKELDAVPSRLNTQGLQLGGQKPALMDARDRMTRINAWMDAFIAANPSADRDKAWEASKADKDMKPLHEAMKAADAARTQQD